MGEKKKEGEKRSRELIWGNAIPLMPHGEVRLEKGGDEHKKRGEKKKKRFGRARNGSRWTTSIQTKLNKNNEVGKEKGDPKKKNHRTIKGFVPPTSQKSKRG